MALYVAWDSCQRSPFSLNGITIDSANTMQLLGVSVDRDLNFNVHVKETVRKVSRKLQVLKRYKHFIPGGGYSPIRA